MPHYASMEKFKAKVPNREPEVVDHIKYTFARCKELIHNSEALMKTLMGFADEGFEREAGIILDHLDLP